MAFYHVLKFAELKRAQVPHVALKPLELTYKVIDDNYNTATFGNINSKRL